MKPRLLLALFLVLGLVAAACGNDDDGSEGATTSAEQAEPTEAADAAEEQAEPTEAPATDEALSGEGVKLTVWDFKSGDPLFEPYYDTLKAGFAEQFPGIELEFVAQPNDQYYTLVGTAIEANSGPDVVMFNAGTDIKDRTDALLALDDAVADIRGQLAGWESFSTDAGTFAVPMTVQGIVLYYNKALYEEAGLDPESPPATWEEFAAACDAIVENTDASCLSVGNKEGFAFDWFFSLGAAGAFTEAETAAWNAGEQNFSDPKVAEILELWQGSNDAGHFSPGPNSTTLFTEAFATFERGDAAHTMGLISDVAHWKEFEEFLGDDAVVMLPPVLGDGSAVLPAEGGIGYAVTSWTEHPELATEFVKYTASAEPAAVLFDSTGAIVSDTTFDVSQANSANVALIVEWLGGDVRAPAHGQIPTEIRAEFERQGQNLLTGTSIADAIAAVEGVQGG